MASSTTQIANLALSHIGQSRIESLSESSAEARWANELYPHARDYVTEQPSIIWRHAKRTLTLEETDNDRTVDFTYAYVRPSDCFSFRYILPLYGAYDPRYPIRFECEGDVIYCDEPTARGVYVKQETDVSKFTPSFTDAMAWHLAHLLVQPLRQENRLLDVTLSGYARALMHAIACGAAEQHYIKTADEALPDWIQGR